MYLQNNDNLYNSFQIGDVVKFKYIKEPWLLTSYNMYDHTYRKLKLVGKIIDLTPEMVGIDITKYNDGNKENEAMDDNREIENEKEDKREIEKREINEEDNKREEINEEDNDDTEKENNIYWVEYNNIIQWVPHRCLSYLSIRLILKNMWGNLIFKEIKTVKTKIIESVHYNFINKYGFPRTMVFNSLEQAKEKISMRYHKNIIPFYEDYYGFTTDAKIASNDKYTEEIFFSKKCHTELNMETGSFQNERSTNKYPPEQSQYICGLVENGEKGLFFRKWFSCSNEFMTLWNMICQPDALSLKYRNSKGLQVKKLDTLLFELSTEKYQIDYNSNIKRRQQNYRIYNIEKIAMYSPDVYVQLAKLIFDNESKKKEKKDKESEAKSIDNLYDLDSRNKFYNNIMWMKNYVK